MMVSRRDNCEGSVLGEESEDVYPMQAHRNAWNESDLLRRIVARYFPIQGEMGGFWPSWVVDEPANSDVHQELDALNQHLAKLSWNARLIPADPWMVQILPLPSQQFVPRQIHFILWTLALLSTTVAGASWIGGARPVGGWFHDSTYIDSLILYSIPLLGVVLLASILQVRVARKRGMRIGGIVPVFALPMWFWPFGLLALPSLPRMDARVWKDRTDLGIISLIAPLTLLLGGTILAVVGVILTPSLIHLSSSPTLIDLPLLPQLLILGFVEDISMRMVWPHPFVLAGLTLLMFGWLLLLPVPTLSGGRLLISRMGVQAARSMSTQGMVLLMCMVIGFLFSAFSQGGIWIPVLLFAFGMVLTRGGDTSNPIILDDSREMDEMTFRRIGIFFFLGLILAMPASTPITIIDDWEGELEVSWPEGAILYDDQGNSNLSINIKNTGLTEIAIDVEIEGLDATKWSVNNTCSLEECSSILPLEKMDITFTFSALQDNPAPSELLLIVGGQSQQYMLTKSGIVTILSDWENQGDYESPELCASIVIPAENQINITDVNDLGIVTPATIQIVNSEQICIEGEAGLIQEISQKGIPLAIEAEGEWMNMSMLYEETRMLVISSDGWVIDTDEVTNWPQTIPFSAGDILTTESYCPTDSTPTTPPIPLEGEWIWDMRVISTAQIPVVTNSTPLRFKAEDSILACNLGATLPNDIWNVTQGPNILLWKNGSLIRDWQGLSINGNFTLESGHFENLTIQLRYHGDGERMSVSEERLLTAGNSLEISLSESIDSGWAWLELDSGQIELHIANWPGD